jgi:hypothetical protein
MSLTDLWQEFDLSADPWIFFLRSGRRRMLYDDLDAVWTNVEMDNELLNKSSPFWSSFKFWPCFSLLASGLMVSSLENAYRYSFSISGFCFLRRAPECSVLSLCVVGTAFVLFGVWMSILRRKWQVWMGILSQNGLCFVRYGLCFVRRMNEHS